MRKEINYKKQENGFDSWEVREFDNRMVNIIIGQEIQRDDEGNIISVTDLFKKDKDENIIQEEKEILINAYMVYDNPEKEPKVDLIKILSQATDEEKQAIKDLLK